MEKPILQNNINITLTIDRLNKSKTSNGGYTKNQLTLIDVAWPPQKGWKRAIVGKTIPLNTFIEFVQLGGNDEYINEIMSKLSTLK